MKNKISIYLPPIVIKAENAANNVDITQSSSRMKRASLIINPIFSEFHPKTCHFQVDLERTKLLATNGNL